MDLRITLDITPELARVAECVCKALELRCAHPHVWHGFDAKQDAPEKSTDLPVDAPKTVDVPKPVDAPKPAQPAEKPAEPKTEAVETLKPAEPEKVEPPKPEPKKETPKKAAPKKAEPKVEPPAESEKPAAPELAPEPEKPVEPAKPAMTIDEIRQLAVKAAGKGKTRIVTDFLNARGANRLSDLDPAVYPELAEALKDV